MSFIVKNSQLTDDTISALNTLIDLDIDAKSAFRLTRIIKEISSILEDKLKMEKRILEKWVQKDEQGNVVSGAVNITDPDSFSQEMSNLMDVENEIPFEKIKFDDLNLQTAKVKDLIKLEFLFD